MPTKTEKARMKQLAEILECDVWCRPKYRQILRGVIADLTYMAEHNANATTTHFEAMVAVNRHAAVKRATSEPPGAPPRRKRRPQRVRGGPGPNRKTPHGAS